MTATEIKPIESTEVKVQEVDFQLPDEAIALITDLCEVTEFTQEALAQESDVGAEFTAEVELRNRDMRVFRLMSDHDLYSYPQMEISVGRTTATIDFENLGLSKNQLSTLKRLKIKSVSFVMFEALKEGGAELRKMLNKLKEIMTWTGACWIVIDEKLPQAALGLEDIGRKCAVLQNEIIASIPEQRKMCLEKIAEWVIVTNQHLEQQGEPQLDLKKILNFYLHRFPSEHQVRSGFTFTFSGPDLIPSLARQAETSAQLQASLNRYAAANVERAEIEAVQRAFDEKQRKVREAVLKGAEYAEERVLKAVEEVLQRVDREDLKIGELNPRTTRSLENTIADLKVLLNTPFVPESMNELLADAESIQRLAGSQSTSKQQLQQSIDAIAQKLTKKYEFNYTPTATGHRSGAMTTFRKKEQPAQQEAA